MFIKSFSRLRLFMGVVLLLGMIAPSLFAVDPAPSTTNIKEEMDAKVVAIAQALQTGKNDLALSLCDEADKIKPDHSMIHNMRGAAYTKKQDFEKALVHFQKAAESPERHLGAAFNWAEVLFLQKKYAEARDRWLKFEAELISTKKSTTPELLPFGEMTMDLIRYKVMLTYILQDQISEAEKILAGFSFDSNSPVYYFGNAALCLNRKEPQKAAEWINSANNIYGPAVNNLFAMSFFDLGWLKQEPAK